MWSLKDQALQEEGGESGSSLKVPGRFSCLLPWESFLFPYSLCTLKEACFGVGVSRAPFL